MNVLRIIIGCFCGGFIGTVVSLRYLPNGFVLFGMPLGAAVGYVACAPRGFLAGCWQALRESTRDYFGRNWPLRREWFRRQFKESLIVGYMVSIIGTEIIFAFMCLVSLVNKDTSISNPALFLVQVLLCGYSLFFVGICIWITFFALLRFLFCDKDREFDGPCGDGGSQHGLPPSEWLEWGTTVKKVYPLVTFIVISKGLVLATCYLLGILVKNYVRVVVGIGHFLMRAIHYTANNTRFVCLIGGAAGTYGGTLMESAILGGSIGVAAGLTLSYVASYVERHIPRLQTQRGEKG